MMTKAVFDIDSIGLTNVLAGLWPLRSLREAEYLAYEVPGIVVPEPFLDRMREAESRGPEAASEEGVAIAREMLDAVRDRVRGIHVNTPGGDVERALRLFEGLGGA